MPNHYDVLRVDRDADEDTIESAFKRAMKSWDPSHYAHLPHYQELKVEKCLKHARDTLLDPIKRAQYDADLALRVKEDGYDEETYLDTMFSTGRDNQDEEEDDFCEKFYSTTIRNYRSQYIGEPCDDHYDEHRYYWEEYTPEGALRDADDGDPNEVYDRAHCLYEPYKPEAGPKRCQGCKEEISDNDTECQRAKHIVDRSKFYVTKCCGYYFHSLCYRRALYNNLDQQARFRCAVCHNFAEGDVVYHAFDLDIFPDVNFLTSPSPWRISTNEMGTPDEDEIDIRNPECNCFKVRETFCGELKCMCFTDACFVCNPDDAVRWMFHLLMKRVIDPEEYKDFVWSLGENGKISDVDMGYLLDKLNDASKAPSPPFLDPNPRAKTPLFPIFAAFRGNFEADRPGWMSFRCRPTGDPNVEANYM